MESFLALQGTQLHYHPEIGERSDTVLVTHISPKTVKLFCGPRKVPYCSTTEAPIEVRPSHADFVPPWVAGLQSVVEDDSIRLYYLLCYAASHDLYNVTCLHPSRFQTVASILDQRRSEIIAELRDGTILGKNVRAPAPDRAAELEAIVRGAGTLRPRDVWPNLTFVTSWSGSYIGRYRPMIEDSFCSGFLPMPSISSEAFATMTIDPDPIGQPLNIRGGVFEFIPAGQKVEPESQTLQFHELAEGESYELVLTTLSGLYRYAMCDIFKVVGFVGHVPRLEYSGRRSVTDLTGEKLAEEQVQDVVAAELGVRGRIDRGFAMCAVQTENAAERPKYVLVLEAGVDEPDEWIKDFAATLDAKFRAVNSRYELKRSFGDLKPIEIRPVPKGTFVRYREHLVSRGAPSGQLKDRVLHTDGRKFLDELSEICGRSGS
jgi:hypothetical protein